MKQELTRNIIKWGNSAGVVLPKEWLNGRARIELVEKPLDIKKDIFKILEPYLYDTKGIYLIGSYARGQQASNSDVDVLVITNKIHKNIERGKYSLILTTEKSVENSLRNNIILVFPMLKEAKPLLNDSLLKKYQKASLTKRNLRWFIETTKSAISVNKADIELAKDWPSNSGDATAYSLVLRLRGIYFIDCLRKHKRWSNKELIALIKEITGSLKTYEGYLRVKNNEKMKEELPVEDAEKLCSYILKKIKELEKWVARRN